MISRISNCRCHEKGSLSVLLLFVLVFIVGCKENPATWPAERVAAEVARGLQVSELQLDPSTDGFEGSVTRPDGETLKVVVTLHPDENEIRWDAKGDRGAVENGRFSLR